jgi:hypothetical protein
MNEAHNGACPNCGYCPHCGRGGQQLTPWYPTYPIYPWYPQPYGPIWISPNWSGYPVPSVTSGTALPSNYGLTTLDSGLMQ